VAWERFAPSPDPTVWNEQDFTVLDQVVARIDSVHGKKRPGIAESAEKLPGVLTKLPVTSYVSKALDSFFLTLPIADVPKVKPSKVIKFDFGGKLRVLEAAVTEAVLIPPGARMEVVMRVVGASHTASSLAGKWVSVSQGREGTQLQVQRGLSKLWLDDAERVCVIASLVNPGVGASVSVREHSQIASVCWME